ncbi:MAG: class I adenylate-forming enzyme family protein [Pseudomonadota bacterium]
MQEQSKSWKWPVPEFLNIGSACTDKHLGTSAENHPAVIVEDDQLGTTQITYGELSDKTNRFAQALIDMGLETGDRVLIRLPNSLAYPIAFFGTMKRGALAVPTSTLLSGKEVAYLAKDSGAKALVIHQNMWDDLKSQVFEDTQLNHVIIAGNTLPEDAPANCQLHSLDALLSEASAINQSHPTRADDPAYLVYTSGTTGYPKGVLHAHRALIGRMPASDFWFDFQGDDRIMHSGKFNWTYVLGSALMDPLYHGKTVIVHEGKNDATLWPRLIAKHKCTIFIGVPTIYRQIIQKTDFSAKDVPSLRHCMSAGEHLSDEMLTAWRERFEQDVYEAIGMSELSYYISQNKSRPIRPGAAGFPQPGHDVQLLDSELQPVVDGEEGMICLPDNDPGLFLEYWNLPEATKEAKHDGYFFTGDYARRDQEGYIWFLGRKDDIINTFGYRVSPHEIERVMKTHDAVADCVALGEEIGQDKVIVALCVIKHTNANVTEEALLAFGDQQLAKYKTPKRIHFMDDFPRTKNGKVLRKQLLQTIAGNH